MRQFLLTAPWVMLLLTACGRGPPQAVAGFALGMTQDEVMALARDRGGFTCHIRGTRPPMAVCEGSTMEGPVTVVVRDNALVRVTLQRIPAQRRPQREMQRFVRRFGEPAWRERPYPSRFEPLEGYHTAWLSRDTTRSLTLVCAGRQLEPPCRVELASTTPAAVEAMLDALLGIER